MSVDWESVFRRWAKPASDTEEERCDNATRMIRDAIHSEVAFANKQVDIFPQGSYHNNTNVRQNSDVDICICFLDTIYYELPTGSTPDKFGLGPATMNFTDYTILSGLHHHSYLFYALKLIYTSLPISHTNITELL